MGAFNWIRSEINCPSCGSRVTVRSQTHVASDYDGDSRGRFHDREYEVGTPMNWWDREDRRFSDWRVNGRIDCNFLSDKYDEEACSATCNLCKAELCIVFEFEENLPSRIIGVGLAADWPSDYLR